MCLSVVVGCGMGIAAVMLVGLSSFSAVQQQVTPDRLVILKGGVAWYGAITYLKRASEDMSILHHVLWHHVDTIPNIVFLVEVIMKP